jgi:hypothetical protein
LSFDASFAGSFANGENFFVSEDDTMNAPAFSPEIRNLARA